MASKDATTNKELRENTVIVGQHVEQIHKLTNG
jgi:hypothetical protein